MRVPNPFSIYDQVAPKRVVVVAVTLVVVHHLLFGILFGLIFPDGAPGDFAYFFVAGQCWLSGQSPYDMAVFQQVSAAYTQPPLGFFAGYLPTLLPLVVPLPFLPMDQAEILFKGISFAASLGLLWSTSQIIRILRGSSLTNGDWFWIAGANCIAAVTAPIHYGQSATIISLAISLTVLGVLGKNPVLTVIGLFFVSAKPILSVPLGIALLLFQPSARKPFLVAVLLAVPVVMYAVLVDHNVIGSYLSSLAVYQSEELNKPEWMVSGWSMIGALGVVRPLALVISLALALALLFLAFWILVKRKVQLSQSRSSMLLVLTLSVLVFPLHANDFSCFVPALALLALMPRWTLVPGLLSLVLLVANKILIPKGIPSFPDGFRYKNALYGIAWALLLVTSAGVCLSELVQEKKRAFPPTGS